MVTKCPVCHHPINGFLFLLSGWPRRCSNCGSRYRADIRRRCLPILPCSAVTVMISDSLLMSGWNEWIVILVIVSLWSATFLLVDKAFVLERRGIRCKQCGYDLRGQKEPHCPECGRDFDITELAQIKLPNPDILVQQYKGRISYIGLFILILFLSVFISMCSDIISIV